MDADHRIRLAIAGGGTGGHVLPALAVVAELRRRSALDETLWIGSHDGLEQEAAAIAHIPFVAIPTGKLRRYLSPRNVSDAARVPLGVLAARRALRTLRPRVVLSTGGFVSVPTVIAARGIAPVLTHEQTAVLGLATRINARFAEVLAVSHQRTAPEARSLHGHVIVTGNPVRSELTDGNKQRGLSWLGFNDALPVVYVTGGARGASPINRRIADIMTELLDHTQVVHQTGPPSANSDAESMRQARAALPDHLRARYRVFDFVRDELPDLYAATDLVIARSGAGTIAELAYVGLPAILIPLPGTGGDEQVANANVLGERGAAVVLPQREATPERLLQEVKTLLANPERRARMAEAAGSASQPDAPRDLAEALLSLAARSGSTPR